MSRRTKLGVFPDILGVCTTSERGGNGVAHHFGHRFLHAAIQPKHLFVQHPADLFADAAIQIGPQQIQQRLRIRQPAAYALRNKRQV